MAEHFLRRHWNLDQTLAQGLRTRAFIFRSNGEKGTDILLFH